MNRRKLEDLLDKLQFNVSYSGHKYWIKAVELYLIDDGKNLMDYYAKIGTCYNKSISQVERCMRHCYKDSTDYIRKYFNVNYKITNSVVLYLLAREMRRK